MSAITAPYVAGLRPESAIAMGSIEMCWRKISAPSRFRATNPRYTRSDRMVRSAPVGAALCRVTTVTVRVSRTLTKMISAVTTVVDALTTKSRR